MTTNCPFCKQPYYSERHDKESRMYKYFQCGNCEYKRKIKKEKNMNPICNICNIEKELKPAGVRKDGTKYDAFFGCPNFKNHPAKGAYVPRPTPQPAPQPLQAPTLSLREAMGVPPLPAEYGGGEVNPQLMQMDLLQAILAVAEQIEKNTRKQ